MLGMDVPENSRDVLGPEPWGVLGPERTRTRDRRTARLQTWLGRSMPSILSIASYH